MKRVELAVPATYDFAPPRGRTSGRLDAERLGDLIARAVIIVLFSFMAIRFGADFLSTGRVT